MKVGVIIQARISSSRFPAKVMRHIRGKPLLGYLLESVQQCDELSDIVVATSEREGDVIIEEYCHEQGVRCHRGSLPNVASRFRDLAEENDWDAFVRISGDSPLLDHRLITNAIRIFEKRTCDMVTNVFPRSFPGGQSVELIRSETFLNGYKAMRSETDLEHVTPYFYRKQMPLKIVNFKASTDLTDIHLAVDLPSDFVLVETLLAKLQRPHWKNSLTDIVQTYDKICGNQRESAA